MQPNLPAIKVLIQNNEIESAGQQLLAFAQAHSSRFANEILGHLARWKQIISDERKGIANAETTRTSKNQVVYALLDLIDEMHEEAGGKAGKASRPPRGGKETVVFEGAVGQVVIQQTGKGDNHLEKKEITIEIGSNTRISAPIVIADYIENSFKALAESQIDGDVKALLEQLLRSVSEVNRVAGEEQAEAAQMMACDAETLVKEVVSSKPRRKWYKVSIEGLKQAALNIGEVGTPVIGILQKLAPLLLH